MVMRMRRELEAARTAALEAGKILMKHYGKVGARQKKDGTLVTRADTEAEEKIKSILSGEFPGHSFLGEETGSDRKDSEYTWVVDPLDGTTNYSLMNPFFNVSICLAKVKEPLIGVVYSPVQKELFTAVKGRGAFLNGRKIGVSASGSLKGSGIAFCHGKDKRSVEAISRIFHAFKSVNQTFRQMGAAALELCYVACGRLDAFLVAGARPWDIAAGMLIVREAGGRATDFSGREYDTGSRDIIASNGIIHGKVADLIRVALE
jgi:myo-inositol-1(or 4)-monophosphatase